jgi:hypothetical protein
MVHRLPKVTARVLARIVAGPSRFVRTEISEPGGAGRFEMSLRICSLRLVKLYNGVVAHNSFFGRQCEGFEEDEESKCGASAGREEHRCGALIRRRICLCGCVSERSCEEGRAAFGYGRPFTGDLSGVAQGFQS